MDSADSYTRVLMDKMELIENNTEKNPKSMLVNFYLDNGTTRYPVAQFVNDTIVYQVYY